jgi:hypothetical protein
MPVTLQGPPDSEIIVPVRLEDVSASVDGFYLDITYDTNFLDYVSAEKGALMTASWSQPTENASTGRIQLAAQGQQPIAASGELLRLHFHIKAYANLGQTTPLHFQQADLNDGSLESATTDGLIKVHSGLPLSSPCVTACLMLFAFIFLMKRTLRTKRVQSSQQLPVRSP